MLTLRVNVNTLTVSVAVAYVCVRDVNRSPNVELYSA